MDRFFAVFGKVALFAIVIGGVSFGAYSVGKMTATSVKPGAASITAAPTPKTDPSLTPTLPSATTQALKPTKTVKAGLDASSGLSFTKYQMTVPTDWTESHTTTNEGTWVDTLILTKGSSQIKIFQAATGGAGCLYPGDPDVEGPSGRYDSYEDITTADGILLRRGTSGGTVKNFSVCQKSGEGYGAPTVFGHISITNATSDALQDVDAMLTSLKKLP